MPIRRLSWSAFSGGIWITGPREKNVASTLRRATGVYPLRTGSIRSRSGITQIAALDAHSLFKAFGRRIAGIGTGVQREVVGVFTALSFAGTTVATPDGTHITFLTAPPTVGKDDYVFAAGSGGLFKINPALDTISRWGLVPPTGTAPSIDLGTRDSVNIDTMDATAGWAATVVDDDDGDVTATFPPGLTTSATKKVEGANSLRFKVFKDKTTRIDKDITVDLGDFGANPSGDEDYIEFFIATNRPRNLVNFNLIFEVGAAASADFDDANHTYSRELTFAVVNRKKKRRLVGTGDLIRNRDALDFIGSERLNAIDFSTAEFQGEDKIAVTRRTWTRVTLPKASFIANGSAGQTGFTWADVKAVRISVNANTRGAARIWVDRLRMIGGVGMQGDYQYMFTFRNSNTGSRSNPFPTTTEAQTGATIFDPVKINNVERQPVELGTDAGATALPAPVDPQVTHIEIWRTVGNGTSFFLVDEVASTSAAPATGYTDRVADVPGLFSGGGGTKFLQPIELPDDNDRPKDAMEDAVVAYGRMFLIDRTDNRVWYSPIGRLEACSSFFEVGGATTSIPASDFPVALSLNANEKCQKLVVWNEQVFVITTLGVYRLANNDEPFAPVRIVGAPGCRFPRSTAVTESGFFYQALDGIRLIDGLNAHLNDALAPIMRGGSSDGLVNFQAAVAVFARGEYMVSDNVSQCLALSAEGGWRNVGAIVKELFWEEDTRILLASVSLSGTYRIVSLEGDANGEQGAAIAQATTDNGAAITFEIETGGEDRGGQYAGAGVWGIAQRIYILGQVEAQNVTVSLVLDNAVIALGTVTLLAGVKRVMEVAVHRAGWITGVRLSASLTSRIEISSIEVDVYTP